MVVVPLTKNKVALIDDIDLPLVSPYNWWAVERHPGYWYACTRIAGKKVWMHRLILNNPPRVDHFNSDGLDNRRENIRACTASQNMFNRRKQAGSSQFKGVSWYKRHGKWVAKLRCHGKDYFLGYFTDEKEAALAYQAAAKELFGEFARF